MQLSSMDAVRVRKTSTWDKETNLFQSSCSASLLLSLQAVRSFQVAIHLCPSEQTLWQDDLAWARMLQKQHLATKEKMQQEEEARKQILSAPELEEDFDFESDEVLAACEAIAERQTKYEELKKTSVVIDADGNVKNLVAGEGTSVSPPPPSKEQFIKVRGLE